MDWSSFLEKGKISTRLLLPIALLTGCLVFLPFELKKKLSVELFADKYKEYIGPAFLVSTVLVLLDFITRVYSTIRKKAAYRQIETQIKLDIRNLTYQEKSVLREFYLLSADAIPLPLQNATVAGLVNKHILYQVGSYGGISYREPCLNYSLSKVAKRYIKLDFIDFPMTDSDEGMRYLRANRPEWIRNDFYF